MGLDWLCKLLCVMPSNFIIAYGWGELIVPGYAKVRKVCHRPELQAGHFSASGSTGEGTRQYTNSCHLNIHTCFFRKAHLSWILQAVSLCYIATFPKMPFPFYRLSTHSSPGCAELWDCNGLQTKSLFLEPFLMYSCWWKAQNQLVLHLHLWLCCKSLIPACGLSYSNLKQPRLSFLLDAVSWQKIMGGIQERSFLSDKQFLVHSKDPTGLPICSVLCSVGMKWPVSTQKELQKKQIFNAYSATQGSKGRIGI